MHVRCEKFSLNFRSFDPPPQANPGKPMLSQLAAKLATMSGGNFDRVIQARAH